MELMIATVATVLATMGLGVGWWAARPRRLGMNEQGFEATAFPLFLNRPGLRGSIASLTQAAAAAVPIAATIRVRTGPGWAAVDVVVPWTHVAPWKRRQLQHGLRDAIDAVRPAGVVVHARVTWR